MAHVTAWAQIPASLTENSPISYTNGAGLNLNQRVASFAAEVRRYEAGLLEPLCVPQSQLDAFLRHSNQYRLLFLQLPLPWMSSDRRIAGLVLRDMEPLGISLRRLEKSVASFEPVECEDDESPLTIGREVNFLRRFIESRASFAEEILPLLEREPLEALDVFYEESMRVLRGFDPLMASLKVYLNRRPSYRPPANI